MIDLRNNGAGERDGLLGDGREDLRRVDRAAAMNAARDGTSHADEQYARVAFALLGLGGASSELGAQRCQLDLERRELAPPLQLSLAICTRVIAHRQAQTRERACAYRLSGVNG